MYLKFKQNQLHRFKPIYDGLDPRKSSGLMYFVIFCYRRLLYIFILVYMKDWPAMQVFTKIYVTLISMFYILKVQPHDDSFTNKMEVINESCILLFNYHLLLLLNSPGGPPELPFQLGWSFISVFIIFLMSNVSILISNSISSVVNKFKKKRENKKMKKQVPKYASKIKTRMKVSNKLR